MTADASVSSAATVANSFPRWLPAYVGVGSNLADPAGQVRRAFDALAQLPGCVLVARSRLYHTPPFGDVPQPPFVNGVAGLLTQLSPEDLHAHLRALEKQLGREPPRERWGPRVIDLDLLVVGMEKRSTATLTLPHPGIAARDFVLYPFADIAADLDVPDLGRVARLRELVTNRGVRPL